MHYQLKSFQACPHCYCYFIVVVVIVVGSAYGDGGVAAEEFADDNVFFQ